MAADFFDGLKKTISQTTKELGKATRELSERAEQTIEAQKIRNKIAGEEKIIEKVKVDIGEWIYKKHANGEGLDSELSALCQEIDQHYLKIREYKDSAANIKGQKVCPSCEREVDMSVSFCPYCGTPCPTPEPVENVEGEAVPVEPEKTESTDHVDHTDFTEDIPEQTAEGSSRPEEKENGEPQAEGAEPEDGETGTKSDREMSMGKEPVEEKSVEEASMGENAEEA